ncbi:MAG: DUF2079 domain-containing protein [Ruminococcus sp.]|nr:DUF2079 domain-containing protein [Ruminococcus sp.]
MKRLSLIKEKLTRYDLKGAAFKLLISWLMVSAFYTANSSLPFTSPDFFIEIKLSVFITAVAVIWLLLCRISDRKFISVLMIVSATVYGILGAVGYTDFSFSVGCCAAVGLIIYFTDLSDIRLHLHSSVKWIVAGTLMLFFTLFVGIICCLYYQNHWTPCFDFGLFAQMFHNMKETGLPLITCERDRLLSHFAVHFSPVFYLLLPAYALLPDPRTLLIMQALVVVSGVIPLVLICRRHSLSQPTVCAFAVIYTLYPCFAGGCFYYLHENNFLAPLILWLIYFCERGKPLPKLVFLLLLLTVKEDAAVYAAVISLYFLFTDKNYKCNLSMLSISVIYFLTVTYFLARFGDGVMTGRYDNYIYDGSGSLITVILAVIKDPVYVISQCFTRAKLIFILQMLLPLGFLPFITREPRRLILAIPFLLINLMTDYQYQFNISFQYCFGSGAMLIYMSAVNFSELRRPKLLLNALCCSLIIAFGLYWHRLDYFDAYRDATEQRESVSRALALIPDDASVAASTFFVAELSQRAELYELERTSHQTEYYVLDLRYDNDAYSVYDFFTDEFETVFFEREAVGVFRRIK